MKIRAKMEQRKKKRKMCTSHPWIFLTWLYLVKEIVSSFISASVPFPKNACLECTRFVFTRNLLHVGLDEVKVEFSLLEWGPLSAYRAIPVTVYPTSAIYEVLLRLSADNFSFFFSSFFIHTTIL